jgi:polyisoprenoid-binding protein YceI
MKRILAALISLTATAAVALEPDQVLITYEVKAGAHQLSGVSHQLEWQAQAIDGDRTQVRLRVPIASFQSEHPEFDAALRKAADAANNPYVVIEGIAKREGFEGTLELAGVARPIAIPLHIQSVQGSLIASASFNVDLAEYGLALPGAETRAKIEAIVRLVASPRAILAGGAVGR